MGICLNNCPTHKGTIYLFPHIHTHKTETKKTIKIKNPKNNIEKIKRREKRKPARKNRDK
jgi:hypothetical protein